MKNKYDDVVIGKSIDGKVVTYKDMSKNTYKLNKKRCKDELRYTNSKLKELKMSNLVDYATFILADTVGGAFLISGMALSNDLAVGSGAFMVLASTVALYPLRKSKKESGIKTQIKELKQRKKEIQEQYNKIFKDEINDLDNYAENIIQEEKVLIKK